MDISAYLPLFPGASREKPRFMALAEAVLTQAVDLQSLADMLLPGFSFALAEGKQLDMLAAAEGLGREDHTPGAPLADGDFRVYLLAKHALWACPAAGRRTTWTAPSPWRRHPGCPPRRRRCFRCRPAFKYNLRNERSKPI